MRIHLLLLFLSALSFRIEAQKPPSKPKSNRFWLGADLSYVNEMMDCGGEWRVNGVPQDPYKVFADRGCSVVRVRIWHNARWTRYSGLDDVMLTIRRAKEKKMRVLLDFHYSDTWTDPAHQQIPDAWKQITDLKILGDSVYAYTLSILTKLGQEKLEPDLVQVGNEINTEILQYSDKAATTINWSRNVALLNRGLEAVKAYAKKSGKPIGTMLHIAQPDDSFGWFTKAKENGIAPYDWIGLSYYTQWSKFDLQQLTAEIQKLKSTFQKGVMVVEAGYPFTLANIDSANNLFDTTSRIPGYDISKEEQKRFLIDLTKAVVKGGGEGVIYWEPAWISTRCRTQWGKGSHFDNATFFDPGKGNEALPAFDYFDESVYK